MQETAVTERTEDLRNYWLIFSRWWWILVVGVASGAVAAFVLSQAMTPTYVSTVKILVQGGQAPTAFSVSDIQASRQLAETYKDLIKTRGVLERVIETLSLPYGVSRLGDKIGVHGVRSIIEVRVSDHDPRVAATVANTVAESFIDDFFDQQSAQIARFQASFGQYGITESPSIIASQAAMLSTLRVVEAATPPSVASSPRTRLNVLLAAVLGLMVAVLTVFMLERLDDSIRSPEDLRSIPVVTLSGTRGALSELGWVAEQRAKEGMFPTILLDEDSRGPLAESYKYLALNLEFSFAGAGSSKTILITSALPAEGKTTNAINLATSLARGGKSVVLVDADLRRPSIHKAFGLEGREGLTNLLMGSTTQEEVLFETTVETLKVVPSGPLPPDPTLMLRSSSMQHAIKALAERADYVILDSPPVLAAADPLVIASVVDGVVLIVDSRKARRTPLQRTVQSLQQANARLLGAVLNKVAAEGSTSYHYYYRYYHQNGSGDESAVNGRWPRLVGVVSGVFTRRRSRQPSRRRD